MAARSDGVALLTRPGVRTDPLEPASNVRVLGELSGYLWVIDYGGRPGSQPEAEP